MQKNSPIFLIGVITLLAIYTYPTQFTNAQVIESEQNYGGSYSENLGCLISTSDGGFLMGGSAASSDGDINGNNNGHADCWVVKTDANGVIEWEQNYGSSEIDFIREVIQTADGGYLLGGTQEEYVQDYDSGEWDLEPAEENYWVIKIDATGNVEWQKIYDYDSSFNGVNLLSDVLQTADGGYLLGGLSYEGGDYWSIKIDANGIVEWEQNHLPTKVMLSTTDGGYLFGGYNINGPSGYLYRDYWIVKTDVNGNTEWEQEYGGSHSDNINSMLQTVDGGYLLGGSTESSDGDIGSNNGSRDAWIIKIDASGNIEWEQTYGRASRDDFSDFIQTMDGNYVFTGVSKPSIYEASYPWVVKIDTNGDIVWEYFFDNTVSSGASWSSASRIVETANGVGIGGTQSLNSAPDGSANNDFWFLKLIDLSICDGVFIPNVTIDQSTVLQPEFEGNQIETLGNVSITSSDAVTFRSNETILNQAFEVQSNGVFCIDNDPCGVLTKPEQTNNNHISK